MDTESEKRVIRAYYQKSVPSDVSVDFAKFSSSFLAYQIGEYEDSSDVSKYLDEVLRQTPRITSPEGFGSQKGLFFLGKVSDKYYKSYLDNINAEEHEVLPATPQKTLEEYFKILKP